MDWFLIFVLGLVQEIGVIISLKAKAKNSGTKNELVKEGLVTKSKTSFTKGIKEVLISKKQIITHRGLEPDRADFYSESTYEAFADQLGRGFGGIEFDASFTLDNQVIVVHDLGLKRITHGKDIRNFSQISSAEVQSIRLPRGRIAFLEEIMDLISKSDSRINALHFKGHFQEEPYLGILIKELKKYSDLYNRFFVFDVKPAVARTIKGEIDGLSLAPSVAHPYDIQRYNSAVFETLITIEEAIALRNLYDWIWLDEWDRKGPKGEKKFYTEENFQILRQAGYKVGLVTPELHATSPGLLGGEAHQDAINEEKLFKRIREILLLRPDGVCTDYPERALLL